MTEQLKERTLRVLHNIRNDGLRSIFRIERFRPLQPLFDDVRTTFEQFCMADNEEEIRRHFIFSHEMCINGLYKNIP